MLRKYKAISPCKNSVPDQLVNPRTLRCSLLTRRDVVPIRIVNICVCLICIDIDHTNTVHISYAQSGPVYNVAISYRAHFKSQRVAMVHEIRLTRIGSCTPSTRDNTIEEQLKVITRSALTTWRRNRCASAFRCHPCFNRLRDFDGLDLIIRFRNALKRQSSRFKDTTV